MSYLKIEQSLTMEAIYDTLDWKDYINEWGDNIYSKYGHLHFTFKFACYTSTKSIFGNISAKMYDYFRRRAKQVMNGCRELYLVRK